jgi:hypothetical protein
MISVCPVRVLHSFPDVTSMSKTAEQTIPELDGKVSGSRSEQIIRAWMPQDVANLSPVGVESCQGSRQVFSQS